MSQIISQLLSLPFEKGALERPSLGQKTLIWGAEYEENLAAINEFQWIQSFKMHADLLTCQGINTVPEWVANQIYSMALCALPKQKEAAQYRLAQALSSLEESGFLVATAANDAGGKRLEKWFSQLGLISHSLSKSKCRVVWATKENVNEEVISDFLKFGEIQKIQIDDNNFLSKPGIYGWNKIDIGSKILKENLPENISGIGTDFGCGYGYLSWSLLGKNSKVKKIYCLDADYEAVEICKLNLASYSQEVECLWKDLTKKPENLPALDFVVMNPPFHEGKETDSNIGQRFIVSAAQSLRKNGVLMMVANVHLPYEEVLNQSFSSVAKITEEQGFKVFQAIK